MVLRFSARESTRREPALGRFLLRIHVIGIGSVTSHPSRQPRSPYCSFAYSALASFRMGMSESASFIVDSGLAAPKTCSGTLSLPIAIR